jgi:hypothetical protein
MTEWKPPVDNSQPVKNWPSAFVAAVLLICITVIIVEVIK